jgi:hypothetical protein
MATKKKSYKKVGARAGKADLATKSSGLEIAKIRYKKTTG